MKSFALIITTVIVLTFVCVSVGAPTCNFKYSGFIPEPDHNHHDHHHESEELYENNWGQCEESELCSIGREQSPINLESSRVVSRPDLGRLEFEPGKLSKIVMTWTGHNQVLAPSEHPENDPSSFIHSQLGEPYHLIQYHLHTPSEHTLDGVYYDAEVHLVHMNEAKNTLAVIGIFVKQSNDSSSQHSEFFETMIHEENHEHDHDETKFQDFDPTVFSKEIQSFEYFHYKGSLTTPPCSEGVNWFVMRAPISASFEQLQRLKLYQRHNSRPIQPVYDRDILYYPEESMNQVSVSSNDPTSTTSSSTTNITDNQSTRVETVEGSVVSQLTFMNEKQEL